MNEFEGKQDITSAETHNAEVLWLLYERFKIVNAVLHPSVFINSLFTCESRTVTQRYVEDDKWLIHIAMQHAAISSSNKHTQAINYITCTIEYSKNAQKKKTHVALDGKLMFGMIPVYSLF